MKVWQDPMSYIEVNEPRIFTFWEGPMPDYIRLCMQTWRFPYTVLTFDTLSEYTNLPVTNNLKRFTLPMIADAVRAHVLRDQGGYWLDADTIMVTDKLPDVNILGDPEARTGTIGMLYAEPHSPMFESWAAYQDRVIEDPDASGHWSVMGNMFSDPYLKGHAGIKIGDVRRCWPETYIIKEDITRPMKYRKLYFHTSYHLCEIGQTDLLMLHNSWTPEWYKWLTEDEIMRDSRTMSNMLREAR